MDLRKGDCLEILKTLPDCSVCAIVTDPPAGISFMGKAWDSDKGGRDEWIAWLASVLKECNRVLKPGGHALVWSLPRTSHWTGMACEHAGFEVRDQISHLFGSGFPKSHNLKGEHQGFGTALKPSREDWWLCRKPISESTVAKNVVKYGTGALNIDCSRIETDEKLQGSTVRNDIRSGNYGNGKQNTELELYQQNTQGRWPSHTLFDEEAASVLDEQSGVSKSFAVERFNRANLNYVGNFGSDKKDRVTFGHNDSGGASRFFYVAKASKSERNKGCEGLPDFSGSTSSMTSRGERERGESRNDTQTKNHHPTVKSIKLMEYLIKLVTPLNGTVLDPFMGSGSTGVAAKNLGMHFIGIEQNEDYFEIARKRIL